MSDFKASGRGAVHEPKRSLEKPAAARGLHGPNPNAPIYDGQHTSAVEFVVDEVLQWLQVNLLIMPLGGEPVASVTQACLMGPREE